MEHSELVARYRRRIMTKARVHALSCRGQEDSWTSVRVGAGRFVDVNLVRSARGWTVTAYAVDGSGDDMVLNPSVFETVGVIGGDS